MPIPSSDVDATLVAMWVLVGLTVTFVGLRLYTRLCVIDNPGADDVAYTLSGILHLLYTTFIQLARRHGYGEPASTLELPEMAQAIKWEMVGQTFAVVGMSVAKFSLGLFLLRFAVKTWQRISIWVVMVSLGIMSILTAVMFWIQCRPARAIYDVRLRPTATCDIDVTPYATALGVVCVIADFFFAAFPAVVIWPLNMKKKDKITLIASLSLGVLAGIAGIIRTYEVATGFSATNYTESTIGLIVWSAVEVCVTMICIGIPILRPLYTKIAHGYGSSRDKSYPNQPGQPDANTWELSQKANRGRAAKPGIYGDTITDICATYIPPGTASDEHILPDKHVQ